MQEQISNILNILSGYIWGLPLIVLLLGTGIYLTFALRGLQFTSLIPALYLALVKRNDPDETEGDISHFQALMTALAATVGVGNIAGVASAIAVGGPGAIFWMWITGLVGMATKYSEAVLAVKFRKKDANGAMIGGPMYYISEGLGLKWLGGMFALFAAIAAFGIGNMVQSNSVAVALDSTFGISPWITGVVICIAAGLVILGGIKSIAKVTSSIVPFMILFYIAGAIWILFQNYEAIPYSIKLIFYHAFTPTAAAGGFLGATISQSIRMGVARGIFSNESGLGSSPIVAAAAKTANPVRQALVSMTQTFIDTIIVCSFTAIVIISSGFWDSGKTGVELTVLAFEKSIPFGIGAEVLSICLAFFAFSTILGWSYYGEKAIQYLLSEKAILPYRGIFTALIFIGAVSKLELVWTFADIMNGLMAFPNLVGLIGLSNIVVLETKKFLKSEINY